MHASSQHPVRHDDRQDLVNHLLAAALHAQATLEQTRRTAASTPPDQPQAAADLADAITALTRTRDALLRSADMLAEEHLSEHL